MKKSEYFILFMVIASISVIVVAIVSLAGSIQRHQQQKVKIVKESQRDKSDQNSGFFQEILLSIEKIFEQEDDSKIRDEAPLVDKNHKFASEKEVVDTFFEINEAHDDEDQLEYVIKEKKSTFKLAITRWYQSNDVPFFYFMVTTNEGIDVKYLAYCGTTINEETRVLEREVKHVQEIQLGYDLYGKSFSDCKDGESTVTVIVYNMEMTERLFETTIDIRRM